MYLAVAVLCVLLTSINLVLVFGVIRRLRVHTSQLEQLIKAGPRPEPMIGVGKRPAPFAVSPLNGAPMTEVDLAAGAIVAFFSTTCKSCEEWLPKFVEAAASTRAQRLVIVAADNPAEPKVAAMVETLRPVATVAVEPEKGPVATAFQVTGFPAMCRLDAAGRVETYTPTEVLAVAVPA